jgi:hypothetical protein
MALHDSVMSKVDDGRTYNSGRLAALHSADARSARRTNAPTAMVRAFDVQFLPTAGRPVTTSGKRVTLSLCLCFERVV